jgi:hypothetical protein
MSEMSPQGLILYKAMHDHHNFLKKQQWVITNYGLVIYAAIVGLQKQINLAATGSKCLLSLVIAIVAVVGIKQLRIVQKPIVESRNRIETTESNIFDTSERDRLLIKRTEDCEALTRNVQSHLGTNWDRQYFTSDHRSFRACRVG